jgi:hypothetical protein
MKGHEGIRGGTGKIMGSVCTVWTGVRFMADAMWPAVHWAAEVMGGDGSVETEESMARFAGEFYGLDEGDAREWAGVCGRVMRLSPLRKEWLAVGKGMLPEGQTAEQVEARAEEWRRLAATLRGMSPRVKENRRAFRTFRLMVEVAGHWYGMAAWMAMEGEQSAAQRAAGKSGGPCSPYGVRESARALEGMVLRGMLLLGRVERTWDQERFADDPKKVAPPVEFFRDDHLILLLKQGLEAVMGRLPTGWEAGKARVSVRMRSKSLDKSFIR